MHNLFETSSLYFRYETTLWVRSGALDLNTVNTMLWKSNNLVSKVDYSCKFLGQFAKIKSMLVGLLGVFFYLGFLSQPFTNHRTVWEGGEYFFNSSLPLPLASQTPRHYPGDYCREVTSTHSSRTQTGNLWFRSARP